MRSFVYDSNDEIQGVKSVTYKGAVNADVDLRPGCVASACITVEVFGSQSDAVSPGERIDLFQPNKYNNDDVYVGRFYAEPIVATKNTYRFTAYDAVQKLNADFSPRLAEIQEDFPMTLSDLVLEACSVAGVTLDDDEFPMYDTEIQAFYANGITCRDILSYAAEIACCFVRVKPMTDYEDEETIEFAWYEAVTGYRVYPSTGISGTENRVAYKQGGLQYSNYTVSPPAQVAVKPSGVEGAAYMYPQSISGVYATDALGNGVVVLHNLTAIDDGNGNITLSGNMNAADDNSDGNVVITSNGGAIGETLIIENNLLLSGASAETMEDVAENIYTRMNLIPAYRVANANLFPYENPFALGQIIPATDAQGVSFYMLSMETTISNSDAVISSTGNEKRTESTNTQKSLTQLAADIVQINKLKVDWAEINEAIINTVEANELKSSDFVPANDNIFSESGMAIDLAEKNIKAVDFAVDDDGKLYASAADIAGIQFSTQKTYTNATWQAIGSPQDGYSKYGAIPYRNLVEISVTGLTSDTIDAKFDYFNNGTQVESVSVAAMSVASFHIPLYTGTADSVVVWLKVPTGQTAQLATRSVATATPSMSAPSNALVDFAGAVSVGSLSIGSEPLNSENLITANRFSVASNGTTYVYTPNNTCGVLMTSGLGAGARGLYFWACDANGVAYITAAFAASALTITTTTDGFDVASTNQYTVYGVLIKF